MQCRRCGFENREGGKFCGECGTPLARACPQCGGENPPDFKFCDNCGFRLTPSEKPAPSSAPAISRSLDPVALLKEPPPSGLLDQLRQDAARAGGERRKVTILFADLKGSTALGERLDAEEIYNLMIQCFQALVEIVHRHEGFVDKFTGDGIMALFGAPLAHGDDPHRAVQASLDMQDWLASFSADLERRKGIPFQMRIGLNFGAVVAGGIGVASNKQWTYDVLGDPVNVAKRLEEMAEPGTIYVSATVRQITRRHFEFASVGRLRVKGREGEVEVYRVLGRQTRVPAATSSTHLIGREREWESLSAVLDGLTSGQSALVTVSGEPGIGKTRLLEEGRQYAAGLGLRTRHYHCSERYAHTPFELFQSIIHDLASVGEADGAQEIARKVAAAGSRLDPRLAEWVPYLVELVSPGPVGHERSGLDQQTRKSLTIRALCELVAGLCRSGALLLLLDDLQWIDDSSLEVLHEIAGRLCDWQLVLVMAFRPGTPHTWPTCARQTDLVLDVLGTAHCLEILRDYTDPDALPPALRDAILARSGGNPYYLEEVIRNLIDSGQLYLDGEQWRTTPDLADVDIPDTVYGAIMARLDRLEPFTKSVVQGSAVVGTSFRVQLVAQLLGVRENLGGTLERLESQEFVREHTPPPVWEYRFKHTAIRDVAYETLLVQQRRQFHQRVAGLMEGLYAGRESEVAEGLAYHYRMAEVWPSALEYLVKSGERARQLFANADALRHYTAALALIQDLDGTDAVISQQSELMAHEGLAEVHGRLADYTAAVASFGRALECAYLAASDPAERALRTASIKRRMARCLYETGAGRRAEELLRQAYRVLRLHKSPAVWREQSLILGDLGFAGYRAGRYRRAERLGRWSYDRAEAAGAELEMGDASNLLGLTYQARGQHQDAIEYYGRTLKIAEATGNLAATGTVLNNLGTLYYQHARFDEADDCYQRAQALWEKTGDVIQQATTFSNAGNVALGRGNYALAEKAFEAAISRFRQANHPYGEAAALAVLGELRVERGQAESAIASIQRALALAEPLSAPDLVAYIRSVLAGALVEEGDLDGSEVQCLAALELTESTQHTPLEGVVRRTLARIARLRGDTASACAALERARCLFTENELPYELGRTCVEQSALLQATGRSSEADVALAEAIELFRRAGAQADLKKALAIRAALQDETSRV
jgi:class 3 adenylate cyclase/tetratricopeptide (TPR) repeat protein